MRELFIRSLKPPGQLWFLFLICFVSYTLFLLFGSNLVINLYGLDLVENPNLLSQFDQPFVKAANKVLLLLFHLMVFVLPALVFNQTFSIRPNHSFVFWGERPQVLKFLMVAALMLAAMPVINFLQELNGRLVLPDFLGGFESSIKEQEESAQKLTDQLIDTSSIQDLCINMLMMAILPALGEEFFFRGVLQKLVARWSGKVHLSIWIIAAIFSAIHFQFYGFLPRMLLGALFGYVAVYMGSIWYAVVAHFVNNAATLLIAFYTNRSGDSAVEEQLTLLEYLPVFGIAAAIMIPMLWWIRKNSVFEKYRHGYITHPELVIRYKDHDDNADDEEETPENPEDGSNS